MGGQKATRLFRGRPLWLWGYELLRDVCESVILLGDCPDLQGEFWREPAPGGGPLPALAYALERTTTPWNLVLALDYPLLQRQHVEALGLPRGRATLPTCEGRRHPLCGYYHRDLGREWRGQGGSLLGALDAQSAIHWVEVADPAAFLNVNHPADLQ